MAFTASAVWEIQALGSSDANGGGFDPGVSGFPTDGTVDSNTGNTASPVFSSASYNFVAGDVGHWVYIAFGTNSLPGWYKIVSVASNKATLNATIGAAVLAAGTPSTAVGLATVGTPTSLTWGIDYSQSATAKIAFTDMVIGGTTTQFTSALNPVGKNFVGNIINVISGTGFTVQRVAIVSTSGTTATCDKSLGTAASTGGTGNLGGALASPALPESVAVAGNARFWKAGAYTISSSSSNVSNGIVSVTVAGKIEGYGSVRGDLGTPPVLTVSGISSVSLIANSAVTASFRDITVDGASLSAIRGFSFSNAGLALTYKLTAKNCTNNGFSSTSGGTLLVQCAATGCSTQPAFNCIAAISCEAYSNTVSGFRAPNTAYFIDCLSYNNSGASTDGFTNNFNAMLCVNCVAYNNGRDGIRIFGQIATIINCIAESNVGIGLNAGANGQIINSAAYLNGTNTTNTGASAINLNVTTLTASAFVAPGSGNFALNANAGGGALLRAAGIPGLTPDGLSTGYLDIGSLQSKPLMTLGTDFNGGLAA